MRIINALGLGLVYGFVCGFAIYFLSCNIYPFNWGDIIGAAIFGFGVGFIIGWFINFGEKKTQLNKQGGQNEWKTNLADHSN